ncbi:MAG: hypothetical protein ACM3SQ_06030 [Betaproteobacteria bacterium]
MELKRRFVFRGNAAAFNGRLIRPKDIVLENSCASSLPVVGGRSRSRCGPQQFGDEIRFESASTLAEGLFDDPRGFEELTHQRGREEMLATSTNVAAEVRGLAVGLKPQLTAARIAAAMRSHSPRGSGETPVVVGRESAVEDLAIDGHKLIVELETELFERYDTRSKLLAAADDPRFVEQFGAALFMQAGFEGRAVPPGGRIIRSEYVHATIVRSVRWDGDPFPGSRIDHNLVIVPNLGRLYFGELLITASSKRLTMLRMELGSPAGGTVACADIENDGGWS